MNKISTSSTLLNLLKKQSGHLFDRQGFVVHCPMVLLAMSRLGATDQQLLAYYTDWEKENPDLVPTESLATLRHSHWHPMILVSIARNGVMDRQSLAMFAGWKYPEPSLVKTLPEPHMGRWQAAIGQPDKFIQLQRHFAHWIGESGSTTVIEQVLREIPIAPASAAFHGKIRLAYGLEAQHAGEIAAGLAILTVSNLPINLAFPATRSTVSTVTEGLNIMTERMGNSDSPAVNITARVRQVVQDPRFAAILPILSNLSLEDLATQAAKIYLARPNITTLHLITATHASRVLFEVLPPDLIESFMPHLWSAFAAAYISAGAPEFEPESMPANTQRSWDTLFAMARSSTRDHMIKLIDTCYQESQVYSSVGHQQRYLACANLAIDHGY